MKSAKFAHEHFPIFLRRDCNIYIKVRGWTGFTKLVPVLTVETWKCQFAAVIITDIKYLLIAHLGHLVMSFCCNTKIKDRLMVFVGFFINVIKISYYIMISSFAQTMNPVKRGPNHQVSDQD